MSVKMRVGRMLAYGTLAGLLVWGIADMGIRIVSSGRLYDKTTIEQVPDARAAVVLGCVRILKDGSRNRFYGYRIRAAAELYKAGKVKAVIVSGDNHVKGYDEPSDMKEDLVAAGIPAEKVVCDYAGFRTLDSVVRAKEVFGAERFIVVSQPFHVRRALFLAWGFGCDAYGYAAEDVRGINSIMTLLREQLAKVAALMDVVIRRQPKFLGSKEALPE